MSRDIVSQHISSTSVLNHPVSMDSHTSAERDPQTNVTAADPPVSNRKQTSFETSAALLGMWTDWVVLKPHHTSVFVNKLEFCKHNFIIRWK
jgi:glutamate/tyrosine decarboxylase-like PLP-dependent enzyme